MEFFTWWWGCKYWPFLHWVRGPRLGGVLELKHPLSTWGAGGTHLSTGTGTHLNLSPVTESSCWKRGAGSLCLGFSEVCAFKSELQTLEGHHQGLWQTELSLICTLFHTKSFDIGKRLTTRIQTPQIARSTHNKTETWAQRRAEAKFLRCSPLLHRRVATHISARIYSEQINLGPDPQLMQLMLVATTQLNDSS